MKFLKLLNEFKKKNPAASNELPEALNEEEGEGVVVEVVEDQPVTNDSEQDTDFNMESRFV